MQYYNEYTCRLTDQLQAASFAIWSPHVTFFYMTAGPQMVNCFIINLSTLLKKDIGVIDIQY